LNLDGQDYSFMYFILSQIAHFKSLACGMLS